MKAAWMAPFILVLAATSALAGETGDSAQQQSQTQGNVSPNAINPGQGRQPDGHTQGSENQRHTDDFGPSRTADAESDSAATTDEGKSGDGKSGVDSSASAESDT